MDEIIGWSSYREFKNEIDAELKKSAESFVRIGYLLKVARDTHILEESGYKTVQEFAYAEYGLDKTMVSRFININDRWAKNNYSDELRVEYQDYGYAKLALMLTLDESINEELTPNYTKAEIQAVKEEVEAAVAVSPMEIYLEGEDSRQKNIESLLGKCIHQLMYDEIELFENIFNAAKEWAKGSEPSQVLAETIKDLIAPAGDSIHSLRISGIGRYLMSTKEESEEVVLTNARTGSKEYYGWDELIRGTISLIDCDCESETTAAERWSMLYGEEWPKCDIAPVQPKVDKPKEPKKVSKVTKAKKPEPKKADKAAKVLHETAIEPLPGQDDITKHPEYAPDSMNMPEPEVEETAEILNADANREKKSELIEMVQKLEHLIDKDLYRMAAEHIREISKELEDIIASQNAEREEL